MDYKWGVRAKSSMTLAGEWQYFRFRFSKSGMAKYLDFFKMSTTDYDD